MPTIKSTDETFDKMLKDNKIVVTDFWASWCNPCLMIAPHLEAISDEMKEVVVAKHNIDEEPNTPTKFGVRGIPTMLLFKDGELASTKVGATTKSNRFNSTHYIRLIFYIRQMFKFSLEVFSAHCIWLIWYI